MQISIKFTGYLREADISCIYCTKLECSARGKHSFVQREQSPIVGCLCCLWLDLEVRSRQIIEIEMEDVLFKIDLNE